MTKRSTERKIKVQHDWVTNIISLLSTVIHTIGILGTIVLVIVYLILFKSSNEQQQEIIDKWILLKADCIDQNFGVKIILLLVVLFIIQQYYYSKKRKLDEMEIERLTSLKTKYQEYKTGKDLQH